MEISTQLQQMIRKQNKILFYDRQTNNVQLTIAIFLSLSRTVMTIQRISGWGKVHSII